MSLLKTFARVAIAAAAAKGVQRMMKQGSQPYDRSSGHMRTTPGGGIPGMGGLLDKIAGPGGGLDRVISQAGRSGGLGGILAGGGLGGGLGGILGGLGGPTAAQAGTTAPGESGTMTREGGSFARKLDQAQAGGGEPEVAPTPEEEAVAALLLRAMIQAAKSDGAIDQAERKKILGALTDISAGEMDFLMQEMEAPADAEALARQVPAGLEPQVYAAALMAIHLDHAQEAGFLRELAAALQLRPNEIARIHDESGAPPLPAA